MSSLPGQRVVVTGAAGFVALNVVEHLLTAGRDVIGLDRIPLHGRAVRDFAALPGRLTMIGGSILSDADLSRALTIPPVQAVIHCAVITSGGRREQADPSSIVAVNVQGRGAVARSGAGALPAREGGARVRDRRQLHLCAGGDGLVHCAASCEERVHELSSDISRGASHQNRTINRYHELAYMTSCLPGAGETLCSFPRHRGGVCRASS